MLAPMLIVSIYPLTNKIFKLFFFNIFFLKSTLLMPMNRCSMSMRDIFHRHHSKFHRLHSRVARLSSLAMRTRNNRVRSAIYVLLMRSFDAIMMDSVCTTCHEINEDNCQPKFAKLKIELKKTTTTYFRANVHFFLITRKLKWHWPFSICFH